MKKEYWKPVVGYEGHYQVSNFGRVKSLKFGKEKILKQYIRGGYYYVCLSKNGIIKKYSVHRLVAQAFLDNPNNLPQINHKDENKTNNNVDNLEWCDAKYNTNFGTCIERRSKKKSKTVLQYTLDGKFVREWPSTMECERNGYQNGNVVACCQGRLKKYKDFIWKYL